MFCRSLLIPRHVWSNFVPKASFSRKVVKPRIYKVHEKLDPQYARTVQPHVNFEADPKYDESFSPEKFAPKDKKDENVFQVVEKKSKTKTKAPIDICNYNKEVGRDNAFRTLMTNLSIKNRREKMNLIVLEGKRIINDAIEAGIKLKLIYFTLDELLKDIKNLDEIMQGEDGTKLTKVIYKDMKIFSSLTTSPGLIAIAEKPDYEMLLSGQNPEENMPVTLVCDNVRDPGNLGGIIRTSTAAGVDKIILTAGCVDAWNDKVIKCAAGAHFHMPLLCNVPLTDVPNHLPDKFDLYIADSKPTFIMEGLPQIQSLNYFNVNFFEDTKPQHKVLIISNEAVGPSRETFQMANQLSGCRLHIPLYQGIDSLNSALASSILIYEMRKQFEHLPH